MEIIASVTSLVYRRGEQGTCIVSGCIEFTEVSELRGSKKPLLLSLVPFHAGWNWWKATEVFPDPFPQTHKHNSELVVTRPVSVIGPVCVIGCVLDQQSVPCAKEKLFHSWVSELTHQRKRHSRIFDSIPILQEDVRPRE